MRDEIRQRRDTREELRFHILIRRYPIYHTVASAGRKDFQLDENLRPLFCAVFL